MIEAEVSNVRIIDYDSPVQIGDSALVAVEFNYEGPATTMEVYAAIGTKRLAFFDEIIHGSKSYSLPAASTPIIFLALIYIKITSALDPADSPYDLYAKVDGLFPETSPTYENVIYMEGAPVKTEILEIDITPVGAGYVTTNPAPISSSTGRNFFEDDDTGEFEYGTNVRVTANPMSGYEFDHWSDEIVGGTSIKNPEYVKPMTEHRAVKAHFQEIAPEYKVNIVAKELEVMGETKYPIPVIQLILPDSRAKVWVTVRNTGYVGCHPRVQWEVKDPDGIMVTIYDHTAFEMISPGEEHKFYEAIETFILRKEGDYTIQIWLQSSESGEEILDYWEGKLCKVGEIIPPPVYTCPYCGATFATKAELDAHIKSEHPEIPPPEAEFPWVPVALIGGGAIVAVAALTKGKKKT